MTVLVGQIEVFYNRNWSMLVICYDNYLYIKRSLSFIDLKARFMCKLCHSLSIFVEAKYGSE